MIDIIFDKIKAFFSSRLVPLMLVFLILFLILIRRVFDMQIVEDNTVSTTEEYYNSVSRDIKSTRGNIYDRNGKLLAYNELKYAVSISETALLEKNEEKNRMIYNLISLLRKKGYSLDLAFGIIINEKHELQFSVSGSALERFKKNAYCEKSYSALTDEQKNSSANDVFQFLKKGADGAIMFQISDDYNLQDQLDIMMVRYAILISEKKYTQITLASDLNTETVAAIKENLADMPGVEIIVQTYRIYNDSKYFAHMIGYTGLVNANEIEEWNKEQEQYVLTDYIGKTGIEQQMEEELRGTKGIEKVTITDAGRVMETSIESEPVVGNDVYLTIDRDLQVALYHLLERNIAEILLSKINNGYDYGSKGEKASDIRIPIYEVYNALFDNNTIQIKSFHQVDATDLEKRTYQTFLKKRSDIFQSLNELLAYESKISNAAAGAELEEYLDYIYSKLISSNVKLLVNSRIDKNDVQYLNYTNHKISLSEFLKYAITKNWVDLNVLGIGNEYYSTEELYNKLMKYAMNLLVDDGTFEKKIYRTLIFSKKITGREICLLLFDQGVLEYNEGDYASVNNGRISAYDFIISKIKQLEITPGELALEPCSGSIVVTDPRNGDVLAMVSYPSYDNNKLANKIDWEYYSKLLEDSATPLFNRPTSQKTTTGSTFKPLMTLIGMAEGVTNVNSKIKDLGIFDKVVPSPSCWKWNSGHSTHGSIDGAQALMHSCNYFYYEVGYRLATDANGLYNDALGISKIKKYTDLFGLGSKSGVECSEEQPVVSNRDAVRTSIGYYHELAPIHIARYVSTIANQGTCYNFTLVDKVTKKDQTMVYDNAASVENEIDIFSQSEWNLVHHGMYLVVNTGTNSLNSMFGGLGVTVAGKTGTAQVSTTHPHHALFVAYAPYQNPEVSITVVLPNGYASANAAKLGKEILGVYFNGENLEELLSGKVQAGTATNIRISD